MRIFEKNQDEENPDNRMKQKAFLCMAGIVLLAIVTLMSFKKTPMEERENTEEKVPETTVIVEELNNVYITEATDTYINVFDGENKSFLLESSIRPSDAAGHLADITITDGIVSNLKIKDDDKISEKVIRVSAGAGIELENAGWIDFAQNMKIYCLYGTLREGTAADIRIGYTFADFVLENGKICGILLIRDESMGYIRVQIQNSNYAGNYHESVVLSCDTDYRIVYGTEVQMQENHAAGEIVTISEESIYFSLEKGENRVYIIPEVLTGKISLHSVERSQGTPAYRGMMEISLTEEGLVVINEVLLEEYLYAVVPSEMPASYPLEALKAQAICARTYAYSHMLSPGLPEVGAHLNDSTGYQVYNNITEQAATTTAVKETAGQLLYAGENLADTYYYSTSCGFGSDEHVWKSASEIDHLTARPVSISGMQAVLQLQNGADVSGADSTVGSISVTEGLYTAESMCDEKVFTEFIQNRSEEDFESREPWYRWSYEVTDIDTEHLLKTLQGRYAVNPKLVLTLTDGEYVSRKPEELGKIENISVMKRNAGGVADELLIEGSKATYKVISELFIRYVLCDGVTQIQRQDGSMVEMGSLLPSGFFIISTTKEEKQVTGYILYGGGFGHGAGMSQNGAKNMALSGYSATQILKFFFTDCTVREVGENGT